MPVKIIICDDEEQALEKLEIKIIKIASILNFIPDIYLYKDGNKVVDLICSKKEHFDILFLDIDMPDFSGIELAKKIRTVESDIILIFVSAYEKYVFESIVYNPFRYIRKNKIDKELILALKAALVYIESKNVKTYVLRSKMECTKINHADVMYFETEARKVRLYIKSGKSYWIRKSIKNLILEFDDADFLQIHSGCVVNAKYIAEFSDFDITLGNGQSIIMSRRRIKDVKSAILRYWREKI